jgi:hypothetical protein
MFDDRREGIKRLFKKDSWDFERFVKKGSWDFEIGILEISNL